MVPKIAWVVPGLGCWTFFHMSSPHVPRHHKFVVSVLGSTGQTDCDCPPRQGDMAQKGDTDSSLCHSPPRDVVQEKGAPRLHLHHLPLVAGPGYLHCLPVVRAAHEGNPRYAPAHSESFQAFWGHTHTPIPKFRVLQAKLSIMLLTLVVAVGTYLLHPPATQPQRPLPEAETTAPDVPRAAPRVIRREL